MVTKLLIENMVMLMLMIKDCYGKQTNTNTCQTVTVTEAIKANTRYIDTYSLIVAIADTGVGHCGVIAVAAAATDDDDDV